MRHTHEISVRCSAPSRRSRRAYVALGALSLAATILTSACGGGTPAPTSALLVESFCKQTGEHIMREDCSPNTLLYDGVRVSGQLSVGPVGAQGEYHQQVLRQTDTVIAVLKDQRAGLCNDFNHCRMTTAEYRQKRNRIDTAFTAIAAITSSKAPMTAETCMMMMQQLADIQSGRADVREERVGSRPETAKVAPSRPAASPPSEGPGPAPATATATATAPAPLAEWIPGRYMMQAVSGAVRMANQMLETQQTWGFDPDAAAFMGAHMKPHTVLPMRRTFKAGQRYAILGHGSEGVTDIDLGIRDVRSGAIIEADTDADATPIVTFGVPADGVYELLIELATTRDSGAAFVAAAVLTENGTRLKQQDIVASLSRAMLGSSLVHHRIGPRAFHESGNWSLLANLLKGGESLTMGGYKIEADTVFLARGDDNANDIDLTVEGGTTHRKFEDKADDSMPIVRLPGASDERHSVTVSNSSPSGTSLVTLIVLDGMSGRESE